jgi:hypothetical protein
MKLKEGLTLTRISGMIVGGTSVTYNIEDRTATNSSGTNTMSSDQVANSASASVDTTSFSSTPYNVGADHYLYIDIASVSGAVTAITVTISFTVT